MGVVFAELSGSPIENYGSDGFYAERTFVIPWSDRDAFASEVLGLAGRNQESGPAYYPGKSSIVATQLRMEPISGDRPEVRQFKSISQDLNTYPSSFAKAIVRYNAISQEEVTDVTDVAVVTGSGSQISYELGYDTETIKIPTNGWSWSSSSSVPSERPYYERVIPIMEHRVTWSNVVNPPWDAIQRLQGTVNVTSFLGAAAETLLFVGIQSNKLYRADLATGPSAFTWKIRYIFRQRGLRHQNTSYGWNHFWSPSIGSWERATCEGHGLYDTSDFSVLFQSTAS